MPESGVPAPVVQLGQPWRRGDLQAKLRGKLPMLAASLDRFPPGDPNELHGNVIATRALAREFITEHSEIDGPVQIDCMWAEVLSPTVVDEILKAWPEATFFNCNEDAADSIAVVRKARCHQLTRKASGAARGASRLIGFCATTICRASAATTRATRRSPAWHSTTSAQSGTAWSRPEKVSTRHV